MIGPELIVAKARIKELEGHLADVAMQAQQLHLQYGGNRRDEEHDGCENVDGHEGHVPSKVVSSDFRVLRDWMQQDPAAREKPPMFSTARRVRPPMLHRQSRQQRRQKRRDERKKGAA